MCRSMADIQSTAAEIRRGKKDRRKKKKETTGQKYNGPLLHRAAIITYHTLLYILIFILYSEVFGKFVLFLAARNLKKMWRCQYTLYCTLVL